MRVTMLRKEGHEAQTAIRADRSDFTWQEALASIVNIIYTVLEFALLMLLLGLLGFAWTHPGRLIRIL